MKCINCGGELPFPKRSDAKYCSVECRDDYNNKRKRIGRLIDRIGVLKDEVALMIEQHPEMKPIADEHLQKLRKGVDRP